MYLAIVMDFYSRRIVSWQIDKRMTTDQVSKAMMKGYNLRPPKSLVFHSDRGSQYTSKQYRKVLMSNGMRASMGGVLGGIMRLLKDYSAA